MENYDFCGWATRNNIKCSDGRVIRKDAFKHNKDNLEWKGTQQRQFYLS